MSDLEWKPGPVPGWAAVWHAATTAGGFDVRVYVSPDEEGCQDCAGRCGHQLCVVAAEARLHDVILGTAGIGQTGFEGRVPGGYVRETARIVIAQAVEDASSALGRAAQVLARDERGAPT